MYTCTMCGLTKSQLGSDPEFEFSSRRRQDDGACIEGISDWCSKCKALRFFIKADDKRDTLQYLEAPQPKQQTDNGRQEQTRSRPRVSRHGQDVEPSMNRKLSRDMRHEVHKTMREEMLTSLPSQIPRASLWERSLRSYSEDRDRRKRRDNQTTSSRRSRSVLHQPQDKKHVRKQQTERRSNIAKDMLKMGLPQPPDKHKHLDERSAQEDNTEPSIHLDVPPNMPDDEAGERAAIRLRNKHPIGKLQELELVNPWQEEVQRRTNQILANTMRRELNSPCSRYLDSSLHNAGDFDDVGHKFELMVSARKRQLVEDLVREMQGAEQQELLKKRVLEQKQLVGEWERIRRRVDSQCDRAKAELNELKEQRHREAERARRESPVNVERQRGGAQLVPAFGKESEEGLEIKRKNSLEKTIGDALDEKLECMLDTLQEKSKQVEPPAAETNESNSLKTLVPHVSQTDVAKSSLGENGTEELPAQVKQLPKTLVETDLCKSKPKHLLSKLHMLVSTVQRARFRGFPEDPQDLLKKLNTTDLMKRRDPPAAQFSTLPCNPNELINLLSMKREVLEPKVARALKICRSPIFCPDADCRRMFFISDFNDHLTHEHPSLAMERITPSKAKTFFLDTRVTLLNKAKCNMVYFVKDKFFDKNTDKYPDLLPVLVMSARLQASAFFSPHEKGNSPTTHTPSSPDQEIFLIWLTSIRPDDVKIIGTISVWPTSSQPIVEYLMVHTNEVYNIRSAQKLKNIYSSNRVMALPGNFINRMTDGGKNLLAVQVLIH